MKKWLLLLSVAFVASCTSIECPNKNVVATYYNIYDKDGELLILLDTLTVTSKTKEGKDTILLNKSVETSGFALPISQSHPEDVLYFHFTNESGFDETDTVWVQKEDYPHFESLECKAEFFHELKSVRCTKHAIDSIVIKNSKVNYDDTTTHFYLYTSNDH